jgi:phosphoribosyl 1,2-cyclic phosphodiesterase
MEAGKMKVTFYGTRGSIPVPEKDMIQGFPFFKPAYDPRRHFTISLCGRERSGDRLRNIFSGQMRRDYFPVPMDDMGARFTFWEPDETDYTARSGIRVKTSLHTHPIETYGYRFEENGKRMQATI